VQAQFPARAVTLIVPSPQGEFADTAARLIAGKLTEYWGRAVLVENKPGSDGIAGADEVAKAKPDGHTLLMGDLRTQALNAALHKKLPHDPGKAFVALSLVAELPLVLLVHPSTKAQSPRELVGLVKPKMPLLKYATSGNGGPMHLAAVVFEGIARVQFQQVSYKSEGQAIAELIAGRVHLAFAPVHESVGHITARKVRALAITSAQRSPALPRLQTIAESGFPGYESSAWIGIVGPAGMPAATVEKIAKDVQRAVGASDLRHKLDQQGVIAIGSSPAQFKSRIERDRQRYSRIIEEKGITAP